MTFLKRNLHVVLFFIACITSINHIEAQNSRILRGVVSDASNKMINGASVQLKNTSVGTLTDSAGRFTISIPSGKNNTLIVTSVNMDSKEVEVDANLNFITIQLEVSNLLLDEVAVVGAYGTKQKRSDLVGSIYQINSDRIKDLPLNRVDALLEGQIPGLQVAPNSDDASSTKQRLSLRIRGEGSMSASNEPLWIIDGTPVFTGDRTNMIPGISTSVSPLTYINPNDIESITVLKDAAASTIYGANAANGVILVTTKSGKAGATRVSLSMRSGISQINQSSRFKVLNADQYMMLAKEAFVNSGKDLKYFPFQDNELNNYSTTNTDWSKVYYDNGFNSDANLSVSGGNSSAKYYVSGGFFDGKSTVIGNTQRRMSLRSNLSFQISKKLDLSVFTSLSQNQNKVFVPSNDYYDILPIYSPFNPDGSYRLYNKMIDGADASGNPNWVTTKFLNSVAERDQNDNIQRTFVGNANFILGYEILPELKSTTQIGTDYQTVNEERYSARTNWSGISSNVPVGYASRSNSTSLYNTLIERLNFEKAIGRHGINALAGFEMGSRTSRTLGATGSGFINDKIKEVSYATDKSGSSSRNTDRSLSYFGQVVYSYDGRYFINVNGRRDGNSGFGSDSRWGDFASVGGAWNINRENFFNSDVINILRLKGSFGSTGNSRIGSQEALGIYSYGESNNYAGELGGVMSGSPNQALSWETAYTTNLGLRIKLFNRLDIELEGYSKKTVDLLSNLDVSRTTGDTRSYRNSGEILNQGIEATINYVIAEKKDFNWWVEVNASHNRNKLLTLYNGIEKVMGNYLWREGHDLNTFYVIRWAGVDPRDGMPMWYDVKGDVTRIYSDANRVPWKTSSPTMFGGLRTNVNYKNFTLNILASYVLGGYQFSTFGRNVMSDGYQIMSQNQSINQLDRWQQPGDHALSTKPIWGVSTRSVMSSTRHIYRQTNVKLKNVSIGYDLPDNFLKKARISNCRIMLIGDNLLIWTPDSKKGYNSYKQSMSGYPAETMYSLALNLTF